jgi:hypothetical protein
MMLFLFNRAEQVAKATCLIQKGLKNMGLTTQDPPFPHQPLLSYYHEGKKKTLKNQIHQHHQIPHHKMHHQTPCLQ